MLIGSDMILTHTRDCGLPDSWAMIVIVHYIWLSISAVDTLASEVSSGSSRKVSGDREFVIREGDGSEPDPSLISLPSPFNDCISVYV